MDQLAGLFHLGDGKRAKYPIPYSTGDHHACGPQDREMLGKIGLRDSQLGLEVGRSPFALPQMMQNFEARCIGKRSTDLRLHLKNLPIHFLAIS